jgi:HD-GYP domain-containing protein (c-di-GMP phosphodiesterase class II)
MVSSVSIRRKAWWRIALVSLFMSIVLGAAQYFYQMHLIDMQSIELASAESPKALQVLLLAEKSTAERHELNEILDALHDHFVIVEVCDAQHKKILEHVDEAMTWVEKSLKAYPPHGFGFGDEVVYRRLQLSDQWFWQVVMPLKNGQGQLEGFFEGVYHLTPSEEKTLYQSVLFSVAMVVMATLITGLSMYPLLLRLTRNLEDKSKAVLLGNIELMEVMGEAIAKRDSDTNIHNYRVTLYAIRLAEALGYPVEKMSALVAGSFLHDVGKIGIPDAILLKAGKLTEDEFAIMKTHVTIGAEILARASWLSHARDIPQYHHEKYDGSGYMTGLVGESIPLSARIFAVVDVFDALTADRPYKQAMPLEKAIGIIQEGSGSHFDPEIVAVFVVHAAQWYADIYQQPSAAVEASLRACVSQVFSG